MHRLVTCQKNLQNIWKHNDKFDIDVSNLINIILRVSSTHDIQLRIMDIWRGKKGEWRMKNDMINIYKWLSKFINIHLTTQEAQELGTRLIYIKNACTLNNFHKRPVIIKHQQAYILFHEIIFKRCMAGWVRRLPKSIFHSIKLDLCFFSWCKPTQQHSHPIRKTVLDN